MKKLGLSCAVALLSTISFMVGLAAAAFCNSTCGMYVASFSILGWTIALGIGIYED